MIARNVGTAAGFPSKSRHFNLTIMKFAHELKEALSREGKSPIVATVPRPSADHRSPWLDYPPHWVESAIPYGQLKKVLKRVARELMDLGLDPETLRQLLNLDPDTSSPLAVKYGLKGMRARNISHLISC